jgi:hypothetical protein
MKKTQKHVTVQTIYETLLERFGEPIGDTHTGPGVADERGLTEEHEICKCGGERLTNMPDGLVQCQDCKRVWMPEVSDYETCGECGYDHAYEPEEANRWHQEFDHIETCQCGGENLKKLPDGNVQCKDCGRSWMSESHKLTETRGKVSSEEVTTTWEDLYSDPELGGAVNVEDLASWLATTVDAVKSVLPSWLMVDKNNDVVEKGMSTPPPALKKPLMQVLPSPVWTKSRMAYEGKSHKKKGTSKKAAKSFIKGTKKFSDKVKKAKDAGMENPEGFAAWAMHKATGRWPNEGK